MTKNVIWWEGKWRTCQITFRNALSDDFTYLERDSISMFDEKTLTKSFQQIYTSMRSSLSKKRSRCGHVIESYLFVATLDSL